MKEEARPDDFDERNRRTFKEISHYFISESRSEKQTPYTVASVHAFSVRLPFAPSFCFASLLQKEASGVYLVYPAIERKNGLAELNQKFSSHSEQVPFEGSERVFCLARKLRSLPLAPSKILSLRSWSNAWRELCHARTQEEERPVFFFCDLPPDRMDLFDRFLGTLQLSILVLSPSVSDYEKAYRFVKAVSDGKPNLRFFVFLDDPEGRGDTPFSWKRFTEIVGRFLKARVELGGVINCKEIFSDFEHQFLTGKFRWNLPARFYEIIFSLEPLSEKEIAAPAKEGFYARGKRTITELDAFLAMERLEHAILQSS